MVSFVKLTYIMTSINNLLLQNIELFLPVEHSSGMQGALVHWLLEATMAHLKCVTGTAVFVHLECLVEATHMLD